MEEKIVITNVLLGLSRTRKSVKRIIRAGARHATGIWSIHRQRITPC